MQRFIICLVLLVSSTHYLSAQKKWHQLIYSSGRTEDISLYDISNVLICTGAGGRILRSTDAGQSWDTTYKSNLYLRSIEWLNASTAFCGSLDSSVVMSTDSGKTWLDITDRLPETPNGICGMDAIGGIIHMVGNYYNEGYHFYSEDGGLTFKEGFFDDTLPRSIVDILFVSKDTGYAVGATRWLQSIGPGSATVFKTTDGGKNWARHYTDVDTLYLNIGWKIFRENDDLLVSLERQNGVARIFKSADKGETWNMIDMSKMGSTQIQGIGALDPDTILLGIHSNDGRWFYKYSISGDSVTLVTNSVGTNVGLRNALRQSGMNRIEKISNDLIYGVGASGVWVYYDSAVTNLNIKKNPFAYKNETLIPHLRLVNNPVRNEFLQFSLDVYSKTKIQLVVFNASGKFEVIYDNYIEKGFHSYKRDLSDYAPGVYYVGFRSFEGSHIEPFLLVKQP